MTDRDQRLIAQALALSILALERLPLGHRPDNNIADMKALFDAQERFKDIAQGQANRWAGVLFPEG